MHCKNHNAEFGYTCPACDAEYAYITKTNLIQYFRFGARGENILPANNEEKSAYLHGLKFHKK